MKKSDLMRANIMNLKEELKNLIKKDGVTAEELDELDNKIAVENKKLEMQTKLEDEERDLQNAKPNIPDTNIVPENTENQQSAIIAKAIIGQATKDELSQIKNLIQEGVDEKGGLLVPADIKTKIIELQRNKFDIREYINIESTTVDKGSRSKEKTEPEATGFASVDEGKEIQALHEPVLEPVEYAIRKYAGFIPITNELLNDSPENVLKYIIGWMAKNELNTYNYQVFNGTGVKAAEGIFTEIEAGKKLETRVITLEHAPTLKDFKDALNISLEEISTDNIQIFTNGSGYSHIDGMEDKNGRALLQPDITKKTEGLFLGKEMVKVPTKFFKQVVKNGKTYTPYVLGDLELLYTLYDREKLVIESTKIGGGAWRTDTTEVKGTFRFDGKINGDIKSVIIILANYDGEVIPQNVQSFAIKDDNSIKMATVIEKNTQAMDGIKEAIIKVLEKPTIIEKDKKVENNGNKK